MKLAFTLLLAIICFHANTQDYYRLHERKLSFNQNGITSMGVESSLTDDTLSGNSCAGQKNLVQHNGVFYHVYHSSISGDADIYLRKSNDGINWTVPVVVNDDIDIETQIWPSLVVIDSALIQKVIVGWRDSRLGNNNIQYRVAVSNDGGNTFQPSVQVSSHSDSPVNINGNLAADAGGNIYAAWFRDTGGNIGNTWFSRSSDGGYTWTTMVVAFSGAQFSEPCEIVARENGEALIVVSHDQFSKKNLIAVTTTDSGNTWTNYQFTSYSDFQEIMQYHTTMVDDSGTVHIVWTYEKNTQDFKILYAQSTDFGQTWSAPVQVSDNGLTLMQSWNYNSEQWPSIVKSDNNKLYVTWCDQRDGLSTNNHDVYISISSDNGLTWDTDLKINGDTSTLYQAQVSLAVRSVLTTDEVLVTWIDNRSEDIITSSIETGINALNATIYPNPFTNELTITNINFNAGDEITITDMVGKTIHYEVITQNTSILSVQTAQLNEGVYFLTINSGSKLRVNRILKIN